MKRILTIALLILSLSTANAQCILDLRNYDTVLFEDFNYTNAQQMLHGKGKKWHSGSSYQTPYTYTANGASHTVAYTWKYTTPFNTVCQNITPADAYCYAEDDLILVPDPDEPNDKMLTINYTYHNTPINPQPDAYFFKTSGLLESDANIEYEYGVYEIRCKVPRTDGLLAAFWLWGGGGEIDVFETMWANYLAQSTGNGRDYFSTIQQGVSTHYNWTTDPSASFHTYQLAWTPTKISWFIDGYEVRTDTRKPTPLNGTMHLNLSAHYLWSCEKEGRSGQNDYCFTPGVPSSYKQCNSPNDPFIVDYVKIYRPHTIPTSGQAWPAYQTNQSGWVDFNITPPSNQTGSPTNIKSVVVGTGVDTKLYFIQNKALYRAIPTVPSDVTQSWTISKTPVSNVGVNSKLVANNADHTLFYIGDNGSVWQYDSQTNSSIDLNPLNTFLNDANPGKDIAYDEVNKRLYYVSVIGSGHNLNYYQYSPGTNPGWQRYTSNVNNIGTYMGTRSGRLYYQDFNGELYSYANDGNGWYFNTLNWNVGPDDIYRNFSVDKVGSRVYYLSSSNKLRYYEYVQNPAPGLPNWQRFEESQISYIDATTPMYANGKLFNLSNGHTVDNYSEWNNIWNSGPINSIVGRSAASIIGETDANAIYYFDTQGGIHVIRYGNCETLNPPASSTAFTSLRPAVLGNKSAASDAQLTIFPNPSHDKFTIQASSNMHFTDLMVFDVLGKLCLTQRCIGNSTLVDVTALKPGIYYCRMRTTEGNLISRSFVVD